MNTKSAGDAQNEAALMRANHREKVAAQTGGGGGPLYKPKVAPYTVSWVDPNGDEQEHTIILRRLELDDRIDVDLTAGIIAGCPLDQLSWERKNEMLNIATVQIICPDMPEWMEWMVREEPEERNKILLALEAHRKRCFRRDVPKGQGAEGKVGLESPTAPGPAPSAE